MQSVCVFCGASPGADPKFIQAATELGGLLARRGIRLVYGGGNVGLMGALADAVLAAGGTVTGVIPRSLVNKEIAHTGLTQLIVVQTMHERKATMAEAADAFIALPGGIGTMEEFLEIWTWGQLGLHTKPYGLLNVSNFFSGFLSFLDHQVAQRFIRPEHRGMLLIEDSPAALLDRLSTYRVTVLPKWIDRQQT